MWWGQKTFFFKVFKKERNLLSHSSGGWKSKIKVSSVLVSPKASLLSFRMATLLSASSHTLFSVQTQRKGVFVCPNSSSYKVRGEVGLGLTLMASF